MDVIILISTSATFVILGISLYIIKDSPDQLLSFGENGFDNRLYFESLKLTRDQYLRQQKNASLLYMFAIGVSIIVACFLIYTLTKSNISNIQLISETIFGIGDLFLGVESRKLHKKATENLNRTIELIKSINA
ncbi:MAG TPA: hypothetical protein DCR93_13300 [Cytophagales bacterium]|nr:hypothetical protein [Cytophagales bacterium]HAP60418.1 hypothetical protein [Cytophagales bacterium]